MANQVRPSHLPPAEASTWQAVYERGVSTGVDPTSQSVEVSDIPRSSLDTLATLGGARFTESPNGFSVRLLFEDERPSGGGSSSSSDVDSYRSARGAAKPHTFAI